MYPELKENRPHGTDNYPYTQYHMHNIFHAFQIPVHWHDELEVIYTKKGPLNLLIDGKEYTAEDGSVYFVAPGQLHLMGSAAGDVDYYTLLFPLEFISFQSDDSLERELFFPLRNHTLSFPCKLPEDHDTAAKASVLLDQIINANSDRIAANQKNGYQNQLGTRILLLKLVLLMAEQDLFYPSHTKSTSSLQCRNSEDDTKNAAETAVSMVHHEIIHDLRCHFYFNFCFHLFLLLCLKFSVSSRMHAKLGTQFWSALLIFT